MKKTLLVVGLLLTLSACSKLTKTNYEQLEVGMSVEEIKAVLGNPDNCSETLGTDTCVWGDEEGAYIKVSFVADIALTFSNNGLN